eukprot:gene11213-23430_t
MEKSGDTISEHIKVFCRQRPKEASDEYSDDDWEAADNEADASRLISSNEDGSCTYYSSHAKKEFNFKFDGFLGPSIDQEQVYELTAKPIVQSAIEGYSGTIFAYGPTGSGKTFTMRGEGSRDNRGVMPRCIDQLLTTATTAEIWVSYLQIYCEDVEDLLSPGVVTTSPRPGMITSTSTSTSLSIREKSGKVFVEGLSRVRITSVDDFMVVLERGDANRSTAATSVNQTSSRSHAAILVSICSPDKENDRMAMSSNNGNGKRMMKESTLVLVDLAGSERAGASEGRPGSLGGGSRTAIIVTLPSGEDSSAGDTLSSLRFASRASRVQVQAKVSRYIDYEALYQETLTRLDEVEKRERDLQRTISELRSTVEARDIRIDILRDEMTRTNVPAASTAVVAPMTAAYTPKDTGTEPASRSSADNGDEGLQQSKKALDKALSETTQLELDLQTERKNHLTTLQQMTKMREKLYETERERDDRMTEVLVELSELRSRAEDSNHSSESGMQMSVERLAALSARLAEAEAQLEGSVSRAQVSEMERLFADTVSRLGARVQQLESSSSRGKVKDEDDDEDEARPAAIAPTGPNRGVRFDAGRVRPAQNAILEPIDRQRRPSGVTGAPPGSK